MKPKRRNESANRREFLRGGARYALLATEPMPDPSKPAPDPVELAKWQRTYQSWQESDEMREFFPENAVEYFVSYYDYYQPEAYVPSRDLFIEKDSAINDEIATVSRADSSVRIGGSSVWCPRSRREKCQRSNHNT